MSALLYMEADGLAELIAGLKASAQGLGRGAAQGEQAGCRGGVRVGAVCCPLWHPSASPCRWCDQASEHSVDGPSGDLWWPWLRQGRVLGHVSPDRLVRG